MRPALRRGGPNGVGVVGDVDLYPPLPLPHPPPSPLPLLTKQSLCVSAVEGGEHSPSTALFVDYHNLPEAVPEHVFPEHFGMQKYMDQVSQSMDNVVQCLNS